MTFQPRKVRQLAALVLVAGAVLAACGDDPSDGPTGEAPAAADLDGLTFLSTEVSGQELVEGTRVTLAFNEGSLALVAGCNTRMGAFTIEDGALVVDTLASTMMACDDETQAQDDWTAELVTGSPQITIAGDVLTLASDDVTLTMVERQSLLPANGLNGGTWIIDSLESGGASTAAPDGAHLAFDADTVFLATGCNRGSASLEVSDDLTATVGPMAMTLMACEQELMEWEQSLVAFFAEPITFTVDGDDLTLDNGTDQLLLHFVP